MVSAQEEEDPWGVPAGSEWERSLGDCGWLVTDLEADVCFSFGKSVACEGRASVSRGTVLTLKEGHGL